MRCPYCGNGPTSTAKRWEGDGAIRRLRECPGCGRQFVTSERLEDALPAVLKRDGRREPYRRDKLARSVALACAKRPVPTATVQGLVDGVEARLASDGRGEVPSEQVGEWVLEGLRRLDEVAYLRFASYQRAFSTASAFVEEVEALQEWRRRSASERLQMAFDFDADQPHWN